MGGESGSGGVLGGFTFDEDGVEDLDIFFAGIMVGGGGDGDLGSSRFLFLGLWPLGELKGSRPASSPSLYPAIFINLEVKG